MFAPLGESYSSTGNMVQNVLAIDTNLAFCFFATNQFTSFAVHSLPRSCCTATVFLRTVIQEQGSMADVLIGGPGVLNKAHTRLTINRYNLMSPQLCL